MASKDSNDKRPSFLKVYPHRNKTLGDRANLLLSLYISRFELFEKKGELRDFPEGKGFYITWKYIQNFLNWSEGLARRQDAALEELGLVKHRLDEPNMKQLRRYVILRFDWIQRMDEEALQLGGGKTAPEPTLRGIKTIPPEPTLRGIKTIPRGVLKQYPGGYQNNTLKLDVNKLDQKKGSSSAKPTTAAHSSNGKNPKPQRPEQEGREMYGTTWTSKKPRGPLFPVKEPARQQAEPPNAGHEAARLRTVFRERFRGREEKFTANDKSRFESAAKREIAFAERHRVPLSEVREALMVEMENINENWDDPVKPGNLVSEATWKAIRKRFVLDTTTSSRLEEEGQAIPAHEAHGFGPEVGRVAGEIEKRLTAMYGDLTPDDNTEGQVFRVAEQLVKCRQPDEADKDIVRRWLRIKKDSYGERDDTREKVVVPWKRLMQDPTDELNTANPEKRS